MFRRFKVELEDRRRLEQKLHATEQELHSVKALFSRTQALLLKERSNAQQMALHIDILRVNKILLLTITIF